jgi:hypothetical protein
MTIHHIPDAPLPYIVRDALGAVVARCKTMADAEGWVGMSFGT